MPFSSSSDSIRSPHRAAQVPIPPEADGRANHDPRVEALWDRIAQATERASGVDKNVDVNSSGYPCAKNRFQISVNRHDKTKPIHGHRWTLTHPDPRVAGRVSIHSHSAAQSPEKDCADQLIEALDSRQGIFEFVSPRAARGGRSKHGPSILQIVEQLKSSNQPGNVCLGGRYEILRLDRIESPHPDGGVVHYQLVARDIASNTQCIVPLTQVGLRFDGRALQKKELLRANHALESHKHLCREQRQTEADQSPNDDANTSMRHGPLIVSHAGIGRNAALITFSDIRTRILEDRSVDRNNLDQILLEVIAAGRQARGPRFLHTQDQLGVVRQMLLELIYEVEKNDKGNSVGERSSTDHANRHRVMRSVDSSVLRSATPHPPPTSRQRRVPAADLAAAPASNTSEATAMDAQSHSQSGADVPTNATRAVPDPASFADASAGQSIQAAAVPPAARPIANTTALPNETARPSTTVSVSAVRPANPSENQITRQRLQELAPTRVIDEHDPLGRRTIYALTAEQFNTKAIGTSLNFRRAAGDCRSGTHFVKGVAGVDEGCWWRAVWLSALLQHAYSSCEESSLEESIVGKLGEQFRPEAGVVTEMIHAIREEGYFSIVMQGSGGRDQDDEYMRLCQLGLARGSRRTVEDVLKKLANALLEASGCDEHARYPLLAGQPGGDELMPTLCHQLQADMVLFVDLSDGEVGAQPYLRVLSQQTSQFNYLDVDASLPEPLTDALMNRLAHVPVITAQGSHFDVAIPRTFNPGHFARPPGEN